MIRYQAAERYSKALFRIPATPKQQTKRLEDLEEIEKLLDTNPKLLLFLDAPHISVKEKRNFLSKILDKDFDPVLYKFFFYLLEKKRLDCISECTKRYRELVYDKLGMIGVRLITSSPINDTEVQAIKAKIGLSYPQKEIIITKEVDPKTLGGVIAIINNNYINFSIRHRLAELKKQLLDLAI